ncbi:MAG: bifunctional serine/threonine-protein kinase/formylglycine-generating enzyme family protein [Deltaproteobacteria bacterium]|nr:bifunctional serine/threonine-protein kinase/formylglycine-generating enzyme family protein [Deltaproteobacteria bacterium]
MGAANRKHLLDNGMILNSRWEIIEHIATGGKGEVYRAHQTNLEREVVVKTVSIEYLAEFGDDPQEVETELSRFHREAMAMAQVRHPHVVQVYDQDSAVIVKDGVELTVHYVVMEYIDGPTLRTTMLDGGFDKNENKIRDWIRSYFLPVLEGIEPIHNLGIVHRDIKPENILLDGSVPKITDFGIAGGVRWPQLTRSHHVEGTITYMAPEQFMDLAETDERGDIYALGKILYESIEGRMVDNKTACPLKGVCLSNPTTPFLKSLDSIVQRATAEDVDKRISCVKDLRNELEKLLYDAEESERPLFGGLHRREIVFLITTLVVVALIFVASHIYHHIFMEEELAPHGALDTGANPDQRSLVSANENDGTPAGSIVGKDGIMMRLVPAGSVKTSAYREAKTGESFQIAPLYMDETQVTNLKFIEFLNLEISRIMVHGRDIRGNGELWAKLGPVYGSYEPIIFENGRFNLSDPSFGSYPVVKVTALGANAYAGFYGERLPSELEWFHAVITGADVKNPAGNNQHAPSLGSSKLETELQDWLGGYADQAHGPENSSFIQGPSQIPYPVLRTQANSLGIRGLNANVSEWGLRPDFAKGAGEQYVVLGGLRGSMVQNSVLVIGIAQSPSSEFVDVGFRCVTAAERTN